MAFWCVAFDGEAGPLGDRPSEYVLWHGLQEQLWLMHYQYSHDGHTFQGSPNHLASTAANWRSAGRIAPGDWLVAYLPSSRFFAVGQAIVRRQRSGHLNAPVHRDTIKRTTAEHGHVHLEGIVHYTDAGVLYEDFTDTWNLPIKANPDSGLPEIWTYPQRIDVEKWEHIVDEGVQVQGLAEAAGFPAYRRAAFSIPQPFFETVRAALRRRTRG